MMMNSASGHSFRFFVEQELGKFPHFFIYAVLEWTLIGLLFLDGFLALVSNEFAEFFDLTAPCVLCTRIDHMLTRKRVRCSYNDCICEGHKKELSSLAYCHVHGKLSDLRTMCESCLLSYATDNGVLSRDTECLFDEEMRGKIESQKDMKDDHYMMQSCEMVKNGNGSRMWCSCCGEPLKPKASGNQKSNANNVSNPPTISRAPSRLSVQVPVASPRAGFGSWRTEETWNIDLPQSRLGDPKMFSSSTEEEDARNAVEPDTEDTKSTLLPVSTEPEELIDDFARTPSFIRGNRFLSMGLSESAAASPRWGSRLGDSAAKSPRWASRLGDGAVASPKWAHRGSRKSLLDRVELAPDPVEAIAGSETDTESVLNRLKRQVRQDRKSLIALYMELDEERSASAVAANNAMAMITRLQAEKAALQMESLQYQRMMEEQAEYDQEALEMLREMLNKREDEIRELEAELDIHRERYGDLTEDQVRGHRLLKSQSFSSFTEKSDHGSPLFSIQATDTEMEVQEHMSDKSLNEERDNIEGKIAEDHGRKGEDDDDDDDDDELLMDIEREKSYLFGQLRMLESRMLHSTDSGVGAASNQEQTELIDNILEKDARELAEKLNTLEEDVRFLKRALHLLKKDRVEGSRLLMERAQSLRKLRNIDSQPSQPTVDVTF